MQKPTMGRRRVEIKSIEVKSKRHTTFTKRRQGLFKKVTDLCDMFDAEAAVVTFSKAGNVFAFGNPSVIEIVDRYLEDPASNLANEGSENFVVERFQDSEIRIEGEDAGQSTSKAANKSSSAAADKSSSAAAENDLLAWDEVVKDLETSELDELTAAIKKKLSNVTAIKEELYGS